jgi:putative oxidoreductase
VDAADAALFLVRLVIGATMIAHGWNHWRGGGRIPGTAGWFESLGLRHGTFQAWMSVVTELGAGTLLILGLFTPLAAAAVVGVMLVAGLLAHRPNGFFVFREGYEYVLVLAVTSVALGALGPGQFSLDDAFGIVVDGWPGAAVTAGVAVVAVAGLLAAMWRPKTPAPASQ